MVASVSQFQASRNHVVRFKRHTGRTIVRPIVHLDCDDLPYVNAPDSVRRKHGAMMYEPVPDNAEIVGTLINGLTIALPDFAEPCDFRDLPEHVPAMLCGCCRAPMLPENCKPSRPSYGSRRSREPDTGRYAAGQSFLIVGQVCEACASGIKSGSARGRSPGTDSDLAAYVKGIECGAIAAPYSAQFTVPLDPSDKNGPFVSRWQRMGETTKEPTRKQSKIAAAVAESQARCNYRNIQRAEENAAYAVSLMNRKRDRWGRYYAA